MYLILHKILISITVYLIAGNFDLLNYYFINYKASTIVCNLYIYVK